MRTSSWLLTERVAYRQCGPHCSLGIVFVRDGCTEHRHHRVADELLNGPSEPLELTPDAGVVGLEDGRERPPGRAARRGR